MCPEPEKRFPLFNVEKHSGGWKIILKYSAKDGIHWFPEGVARNQDRWGIVPLLSIIQVYSKMAISLRQGSKADGRSRGYLENEDPEMAVSVAKQLLDVGAQHGDRPVWRRRCSIPMKVSTRDCAGRRVRWVSSISSSSSRNMNTPFLREAVNETRRSVACATPACRNITPCVRAAGWLRC